MKFKITSFNSRTREGATHNIISVIYYNYVSIHAPVRVRQFKYKQFMGVNMFQFTHP